MYYYHKSLAYTSLIQPQLEYASSVWDLYLNKTILGIEVVQRRAACWMLSLE